MTSTGIDATNRSDGARIGMGPFRTAFMKLSMKVITGVNLKLLALSDYRIGYSFLGQKVVVLHTTGRKTGKHYRTPLFYMDEGDKIVLVASRAATTTHPGWLRNLEVDPSIEVQFRSSRRRMKGHIAEGEEREQLWVKLIAMFEVWERIQEKSPRLFPVVVLEPESAGS